MHRPRAGHALGRRASTGAGHHRCRGRCAARHRRWCSRRRPRRRRRAGEGRRTREYVVVVVAGAAVVDGGTVVVAGRDGRGRRPWWRGDGRVAGAATDHGHDERPGAATAATATGISQRRRPGPSATSADDVSTVGRRRLDPQRPAGGAARRAVDGVARHRRSAARAPRRRPPHGRDGTGPPPGGHRHAPPTLPAGGWFRDPARRRPPRPAAVDVPRGPRRPVRRRQVDVGRRPVPARARWCRPTPCGPSWARATTTSGPGPTPSPCSTTSSSAACGDGS